MILPTMSEPLRAVTVFSASSTKIDRVYFDAADELGYAIAQSGWDLVYGGNDVGPMGALAAGARRGRGRVIGVTPQVFIDAGHADTACDELILVDSMRQRKATMETRGDAFITLPGGLGTLEEFFEIVVGQFLGFHAKPIVLLNINGFYDDLLHLIQRQIEGHFVRPAAWEGVHVTTSVTSAIDYLKGYTPQQPASRL
jgi:uncharacterized protein (TIGR00730 family)